MCYFLTFLQDANKSYTGAVVLKLLPKAIVNFAVSTGLISLITNFFKYSSRTLTEVVDELTNNEELKAVLCYSFGDYGEDSLE